MEEEYLKTMALLKAVEDLRWIDRDKGQFEFYEKPPVDWPCTLIKTEILSSRDLGNGYQQCMGQITLRTGFRFVDETSSVTPDDVQENSLEYYRTSQKVYLALQGKAGGRGGKYSRIAQGEETRDDGITVVRQIFQLPFLDKSAAGQ